MKRITVSIFLLLTVLAVYAADKKPTSVSGFITNPTGDQIKLSFPDNFITYEEKQFYLSLDPSGQFTITLFFDAPTEVLLSYGVKEIRLFLEPGDDLKMDLDARYNNALPVFHGNGAVHNNFLMESHQLFGKYNTAYLRSQMKVLTADRFKSLISTIRNDRYEHYHKQNHPFSSGFRHYYQADMDYWWAYHLMQYRWEHSSSDYESFPIELPREYYDFLAGLEISNAGAMSNPYYIYFIQEYMSIREEWAEEELGSRYVKQPFRNARNYFKGQVLDFVLANEMYLLLKRKKHQLYEYEIRQFIENTPYAQYADLLSETLEGAKTLKGGQLAPDFSLVDIQGKTVKLSDYRGKVVVLDFWATWCPPCINEMPHTQRIKRYFSSDKVVVLYISMDTNEQAWKDFVRSRQLTGVQLFAQGGYRADIAKKYNVKALPHFYLIDQDGKIVSNPAKLPSRGLSNDIGQLLIRDSRVQR